MLCENLCSHRGIDRDLNLWNADAVVNVLERLAASTFRVKERYFLGTEN
jgi:hypothetical protein